VSAHPEATRSGAAKEPGPGPVPVQPSVAEPGPVRIAGVDDPRITLMGLLVEAHAHLTRVLGRELEAATGLPLSWFDVLIRIGRSPEGRLTMTQLAGEVSFTSGGITRLVDRIAADGYVERMSCPTDRRSVYVGLTPAGAAALEEATAAHIAGLEQHLIGPLSASDRAGLEHALRKLRSNGPICGAGEAADA